MIVFDMNIMTGRKRASAELCEEAIVSEVYTDISSDISDNEPNGSLQTSDNGKIQFCSVTLHKDTCFQKYHCHKYY
jgi:hypothetical protein